jgi:Zn-finger nucleic acid-binding protein
MLNACACGRQYDVSHRSPGDRVRCECGVRFLVEFRQPHSPRALRCSSCGANLTLDGRACPYCAAEVTLEERRLSSVCPGCFARAAVDARFCMECGLRIEPQALAALPAESRCPRCQGAMRQRALGSASVAECAGCGGLWLAEEHFDRLCEAVDEADLASRGLSSVPPPRPADAGELRYLPCVECGDLMNRRNYASSSGIIIDVCRHHGVWLDHAELQKILAFVREGGLDRARQRQIERLKDQERRTRNASSGDGRYALPVDQQRDLDLALNLDLLSWVARLAARFL